MKRRGKLGGKLIRRGYRALSVLNTLSILLSGDVGKIIKHYMRKRVVQRAGRLF